METKKASFPTATEEIKLRMETLDADMERTRQHIEANNLENAEFERGNERRWTLYKQYYSILYPQRRTPEKPLSSADRPTDSAKR